jgi:hypothetical protein
MLVGLRHYNHNASWPKAGRDGRRRVQVPFINWSFDVAAGAEQDKDTVGGYMTLVCGCWRCALPPCHACCHRAAHLCMACARMLGRGGLLPAARLYMLCTRM